MRLIGTYTQDELKRRSVLCDSSTSPYYFSIASNVGEVRNVSDKTLDVPENEIVSYHGPDNRVYLPFSISGCRSRSLRVLRENIGSIYVESQDDLVIDGIPCNRGTVKIEFKKFKRSSQWDEHIASKFILENYGKDSTAELVEKLDSLAQSSR